MALVQQELDRRPESIRTPDVPPHQGLKAFPPWKKRWKSATSTIFQHAKLHAGVGIVCAVSYFDP